MDFRMTFIELERKSNLSNEIKRNRLIAIRLSNVIDQLKFDFRTQSNDEILGKIRLFRL